MQACAPHLEHLCELDVCCSNTLNAWGSPRLLAALELLLRQMHRLKTLWLTQCNLEALPTGPYLSGERTLGLGVSGCQLLADSLTCWGVPIWQGCMLCMRHTQLLVHTLSQWHWCTVEEL